MIFTPCYVMTVSCKSKVSLYLQYTISYIKYSQLNKAKAVTAYNYQQRVRYPTAVRLQIIFTHKSNDRYQSLDVIKIMGSCERMERKAEDRIAWRKRITACSC